MVNGNGPAGTNDGAAPSSLVLRDASGLPDPIDVLIVGAGAAGTGAAFRAKELGLSVLVIDRDEILSLLREWMSIGKHVDSSYGPGGKLVPFPDGADLVAQLVFGDQVPASEVYNRWISVYAQQGIPACPNFEFLGHEPVASGVLKARCLNLRTRAEQTIKTRSIVLAMGRGVPTRLDIPGNAAGIHYKLKDAEAFVGGPACVVGGGTSAAEAVIAISKAKAAKNDESDVFWSYRRRNLPKVNSTLAEEFFKAYAGYGNIRYLPFSVPLAILRRETGDEFVALRSDRREIAGRPPEGTYYEFPKERVLTCIGAELPVGFLAEIGIHMLKSAETEENLMPVSRLFESQVPNVFLIGDVLAPSYIRTSDFSPEAASQATVVDHIGNFKQGMTDGVLVVEAIAQRLRRRDDAGIAAILDQKELEYQRIHEKRLQALKSEKARVAEEEKKVAVPVAAPAAAPEPEVRVGAKFARVTYADGQPQEVEQRFMATGQVLIGRTTADWCFSDDDSLKDPHVAILMELDACYVSDEGMQGESYIDVRVERTVKPGDLIFAGSYAFRVDASEKGPYLSAWSESRSLTLPPLAQGVNVFGRNIDPSDVSLSRRHFTLQVDGNVLRLSDFGSTNHTYLKVQGPMRLYDGDEICAGTQRLRFKGLETGAAAPAALREAAAPAALRAAAAPAVVEATIVSAPAASTAEASAPAPAAAPAAPPAELPAGPPAMVVLNPEIGETIPLEPEQPLLAKLKAVGIAAHSKNEIGGRKLNLYSCERGDCGLCIFRVAAGATSLSAATPKEKKLVKKMVKILNGDQGRSLDEASCRLACLVKATGPFSGEFLGDTDAE